MKKYIELMKKDGKLPYGKETLIRFEEDFFIDTDEINEVKIKYSSIEKIAICAQAIYIYISVQQASIIPLSVFETEEQKAAFLAFIHNKAGITA